MASIRQLLLLVLLTTTTIQKVQAQNLPVPSSPKAPKINQPVLTPPKLEEGKEDSGIEVLDDTPTQKAPVTTDSSDNTDTTENQDSEAANEEEDSQLPKAPQNPFEKPSIDTLIQKQFNDDIWRIMKGQLPCVETSATCLEELQGKAVGASALLKELDTRIEEANNKIAEAQSRNKKSIRLAVLSPALQYLLGPTVAPGQPQRSGTGFIDNVAALIRGDVGIVNGLLRVIGVPFFEGSQGGNAEAQRNAIAISDIQVKVAELQRGRAKIADEIREKVAVSLVKFDEARTDFQTAQIVGARAIHQFELYRRKYNRGNNDTEGFLAQKSKLDKEKAQVYTAWAKMRRNLFELKLLVLSVKEAEI